MNREVTRRDAKEKLQELEISKNSSPFLVGGVRGLALSVLYHVKIPAYLESL